MIDDGYYNVCIGYRARYSSPDDPPEDISPEERERRLSNIRAFMAGVRNTEPEEERVSYSPRSHQGRAVLDRYKVENSEQKKVRKIRV